MDLARSLGRGDGPVWYIGNWVGVERRASDPRLRCPLVHGGRNMVMVSSPLLTLDKLPES